ncbi:choice-of-anchor I domain-containing protein [Desulfosarcina sp.]|uniref:choice-of-anchor I domain-containing protein n=1 Tax=Desulfosarcina sp. TaxID=2027861 RepID=UPI003970E45F
MLHESPPRHPGRGGGGRSQAGTGQGGFFRHQWSFPQGGDGRRPAGHADFHSADKGPEPEGLSLGEINCRTYLFLGLERIGGIMVYDISLPRQPEFVQ